VKFSSPRTRALDPRRGGDPDRSHPRGHVRASRALHESPLRVRLPGVGLQPYNGFWGPAIAYSLDGKQLAEAARTAELDGVIFSRTGGYYPAIDVATLSLVSGDAARARELAAVVLGLLGAKGDSSYYAVATEGEAHSLCGDEAAARGAAACSRSTWRGLRRALATTRRQLRTICELSGIDPQLLSVLAGPEVVHFCGHRIANEHERGRFPREEEAMVAARIAKVVERNAARFAYGSLASGADILWAEALLARGSELHVMLPFARDEFIEQSVAPSGSDWRTSTTSVGANSAV